MEKVKLSTLPRDAIVLVDGCDIVYTVSEIIGDADYYKGKDIYTTIARYASFDAESIIDNSLEWVCQDMYEGWYDNIRADVTEEDIEEIQAIFDRILARNPSQNICYFKDKLIEFDI